MDDLVKRLKIDGRPKWLLEQLCKEAAARITELESALKEIAAQKLINEFPEPALIQLNGDFEKAYELLINRARIALSPSNEGDGNAGG